jgi:demethylmenaquinone methyltransferase/2-methoxy-6-polyprenyl-1,4-benzoquinol methylase
MTVAETDRNRAAQSLFAPLAPTYDRYARLLSFGQDPRWRRLLVSHVGAGLDSVVLDVATGTGAVAIELARRTGCRVVGIDQSEEMLVEAEQRVRAAGLSSRIELRTGRAERLPFDDGSFDALTVTYLLRYVDDPVSTLAELARVVTPGGTLASLEFSVPQPVLTNAAWRLYTGIGLPALGALASPDWQDVGRFLRPSIEEYVVDWPLESQLASWQSAGVSELGTRSLSLGGGRVIWGRRNG